MGNCKAKTEVFSRVVGYYTPVQQWNPGKRQEFHTRKPYLLNKKAPAVRPGNSPKRKDKS